MNLQVGVRGSGLLGIIRFYWLHFVLEGFMRFDRGGGGGVGV